MPDDKGNCERLCAIGVDEKDIIARYKMYDNWNVLVAEQDGKIAGWIGWTFKSTPERKGPYVYITEIMKKLKPQIETWSIFAKSFEGNLPTFSPLYVDIRDMIP